MATSITFITDTHYYSKTLGTCGESYTLRSNSDQKCLAETEEIITSAFDYLSNSDCDAVAIIGDVSNDGECVSHTEFREKLYDLKKSKDIFVVTATHDWCCDKNPRRFDGDKVYNDVPVMKSEELYDFYGDFGKSQAISQYKTHIGTYSYAVDIGEDITLIALNDDKNEVNHAGFVPEHFEWILEQVKSAKQRGRIPVAMEHHPLYRHITPLMSGSCVAKGEEFLDDLADAGLEFIFVGHTHIQRIDCHTSKNGNKIYEINVASLVGYPAPMVTFKVDSDSFDISTEFLKNFVLDGKTVNATEYLKSHAIKMISVVFEDIDNKEMFAKRLMDKYVFVKPILKCVDNLTVKKASKLLNTLTFGKAIPKSSVKVYSQTRVMEIVENTFLSALDGGIKVFSPDDDYYKIVRSAVNTPYRIAKKLKVKGNTLDLFKKLDLAIDEVLTGGKISNHTLHIKRGK